MDILGSDGREVDLHMDIVAQEIDQCTTPVGRVVYVPIGQTVD
jgi:hypothetical protein